MFGRNRTDSPTEVVVVENPALRREHEERIARIRRGHADWDARLAAAESKRAAEEREQTERALAQRERLRQQEQASQAAWGQRLRELEAALAAAESAVRNRAALMNQARDRGDTDSAVRLAAELVGAERLVGIAERELAAHRPR